MNDCIYLGMVVVRLRVEVQRLGWAKQGAFRRRTSTFDERGLRVIAMNCTSKRT